MEKEQKSFPNGIWTGISTRMAWIQFKWMRVQFAMIMLAALLQRLPVVKHLFQFERTLAQPLSSAIQRTTITAASLGMFHGIAGATSFVMAPGPSPRSGKVGEEFGASFTVTGAPVDPARWVIQGTVAPGLSLRSLSGGHTLIGNEIRGAVIVVEGTPTTPGIFTFNAQAFNSEGDTDNNRYEIQINVSATAPEIESNPDNTTVATGGRAQFFFQSSLEIVDIQWLKNGTPIPDETGPTLVINNVGPSDAAEYSVRVSNAEGTDVSSVANLSIDDAAAADLVNLSNRGLTLTGDGVMIPGFTIAGGSKKLLVRAAGPALDDFGVDGTLDDPTMRLVPQGSTTDLATNDDWEDASNADEIRNIAGPFPFPDGSKDSALLVELAPGPYTVVTSGVNDTTGVVLVELYDQGAPASGTEGRVTNISTRGQVGLGASIMIPGLVIEGSSAKTLLIRVAGPTLGGFGVSGVLSDPQLQIYEGSQLLISNDDWELGNDASEIESAFAQVGAFDFESGSRDAAIVVTLNPGAYTIQASGVGNTTGVALVEVYTMD